MPDQADTKCVSLFFDSAAMEETDYGAAIFSSVFSGKELSANSRKVIVSFGDVFLGSAEEDIRPLVVADSFCTIDLAKCENAGLTAVILEDIDASVAVKLDSRLQTSTSAYLGMTSINVEATDLRKQYWKRLSRAFSIERDVLTFFRTSQEIGWDSVTECAKQSGLRVHVDEFPLDDGTEQDDQYVSSRQSSFIQCQQQRRIVDGKNDSSRSKTEMNFALVREVGLSGVLIWKAVEDIDAAVFPDRITGSAKTDYAFTSLYMASQGIERLLKICTELIKYATLDETINIKADEQLKSHNHVTLLNFVCNNTGKSRPQGANRLMDMLMDFYTHLRYGRYWTSDTNDSEFRLLSRYGRWKNSDDQRALKHAYAKALGTMSHFLYGIINDLCTPLKIFVYELAYDSVAMYCFLSGSDMDLMNTLERLKTAKRELIWLLINNPKVLPATRILEGIEPLDIDPADVPDMVSDLISPSKSSSQLLDAVDELIHEVCDEDRKKQYERIQTVNLLTMDLDTGDAGDDLSTE